MLRTDKEKDFALWTSTDHKEAVLRELPGCAQSTQVSLVKATSGFKGQAMLYPLTDHLCVWGYDVGLMPSYVQLSNDINMAFPSKGRFQFESWITGSIF